MSARPNLKRRRRPSDTVHLRDVAAQAGVSTATVSRVLNGTAMVSDGVRERVERATKKLGYVPNGAARALSSRRMHAIGAIVPSIENSGFAAAISGLQRRLDESGFSLLLASSQYDPKVELREATMLLSHGVDGLMIVGGDHHKDLLPLIQKKQVPFVETWTKTHHHPCVGFDNAAAAARLTEYLLDIGHTRIGVIAGQTQHNDRASRRVAGVRRCLAKHGLTLESEWLIERPYRIPDGRLAMKSLLSSAARPTAIICGNDQLAFGAIIEATSQGLKIPEDISIAGFNDLDYAAYLNPPLTTMHVPAEQIGRAAGDYLLGKIAGTPTLPITEIEVNLIVRGSTGPLVKQKRGGKAAR
ncbi:MAG: LacI family DNA-binding transcriptional regulator [Variibacter sp.]